MARCRRAFLHARSAAVGIQSQWRGCVARCQFAALLRQHRAAVSIQAAVRGCAQRRRYRRALQGVLAIQVSGGGGGFVAMVRGGCCFPQEAQEGAMQGNAAVSVTKASTMALSQTALPPDVLMSLLYIHSYCRWPGGGTLSRSAWRGVWWSGGCRSGSRRRRRQPRREVGRSRRTPSRCAVPSRGWQRAVWAGTQTPSLPVAHTLRLLTKCLAVIVALNLIPCWQAIKRDFGVDAAQIRRVLGLWQVGPAAPLPSVACKRPLP